MKPPIWFSAGLIAASVTAASATPQNASHGLSPAEEWVVAQVTAGEIADLSKKFPEEGDRKLSAQFLHDLLLLTGELSGIKVHRNGVRIVGATIDEPIDINNAQILWDMWLEQCLFIGGATMHHVSFAWNVSFENSTFKDAATFESIRVGHLAHFDRATFGGPANFSYADIANNFEARRATFPKNGAVFSSMKVGGAALFNGATFEGPANFSYADIANNFEAHEATFQENGAVFNGMKVGGAALFDGAMFKGRADFSYANIANNFNANKAMFRDEKNGAVFSGMKVGGDATFYSAVFNGPVDFNYADFARLSLSCPFSPEVAAKFHMQGMSYKYIRAVPRPEPSAGSYKISLSPHFNAYIPKFPQFGPSPWSYKIPLSFPQFESSLGLYPESAADLQLEPESDLREELLNLAKWSAYSADVYSSLEEFFLRQGDRGDADNAFFAGKQRERDEYRCHGHWLRWLRSWMLYLLVGYGRRPWQAGIPCAVLIALGCILFSPKKMEPQKPEDTPRVYNRFWYSLGLFLPFVDLQADKVWKPKADQIFLRNYMRVHILLGWILVPLVLAALTGLIK